MKASEHMQRIITAIAAKHGLDLSASEAHLRLEMPGYDRLVIEKIGPKLISVAHYFTRNGDSIADPDIVFFMSDEGWIPTEITQVFGYQRVAYLRPDGMRIIAAHHNDQLAVTIFADDWAQAIHDQGWLEHGQAARPARNAA
jgi:hypothetical protein